MNKNILLGVTGGIAAYKSADLVRRLKDAGAQVQVAMTKAATEFVGPLTFQALSGNPVHTDLLNPDAEAAMGHIQLARWADLILIAPASANLMARLAQGSADDLLTTLCLASESPIALAPAMNRIMWSDSATQSNLNILRKRGVEIFGPGAGDQACGEVGEGRMLEPAELLELSSGLFKTGSLDGKRVLLTAGPTREPIDPVRYISNHSSGKMGFAIAEAAVQAGAKVTLIAGPVSLVTPAHVRRLDVEQAEEMYAAVIAEVDDADIFIASAAVADYKVAEQASHKIKKTADNLHLILSHNPDILAAVSSLEQPPFTLGFAAETLDLETHALDKLQRKHLNMIAANWVGDRDIGFNSDNNALEVFWNHGRKSIPKAAKSKVARELIQLLSEHLPPNT